MAVAYEQFENDPIEADSLHSSDSDDTHYSDQILVIEGAAHSLQQPHTSAGESSNLDQAARIQRMHYFLHNKWPLQHSTVKLVVGVILICMGTVQIFILPIINDSEGTKAFAFEVSQSNVFGIGEWIGILLLSGGVVGVRAALYNSIVALYIYFGALLVELLAISVSILLLIIAYSEHWVTLSGLHDDKVAFYLQLSVTLMICVALLVVIYSFLQYYEDVLFGDLQCCKRTIHCFLPCICPKPVQEHELLNECDERPPSLPV